MSMTDSTATDSATPTLDAAITEAIGEVAQLDLSLLVEDELTGKVLTAAQECRKYALALENIFGQKQRSGTLGDGKAPLAYPVSLPVEITSKVIPGTKTTEMQQVSAWLDDHVPLNGRYRWAVTSAGAGDKVMVKIVKMRDVRDRD